MRIKFVLALAVVEAMLCVADTAEHPFRGALFGLDLGTSSIKVAAPKFNSTLDIVLNEQSRRKTPNVVGFRKSSRYVGEEALSLAARFPSLMVPAPHKLAGLKPNSSLLPLAGQSVSLVEDSKRGSASVSFATSDTDHVRDGAVPSAEELTSMLVEYAASITTAEVGEKAAAAVVAIPHSTPLRQRIALRTATELAGMYFVGFVHSLTAAAMQYGAARGGFGNKTVYVTVVDVGAGQAQAGLFRFDPAGEKVPFAESLGTLTTVAVASDIAQGSGTVDNCVARLIDASLMKKHGPKMSILNAAEDDDKQKQRLYALSRAANSVKEAFSVATGDVTATVEGALADGGDFQTQVSRSKFDSQCVEPHAAKVAQLAETVSSFKSADFLTLSEAIRTAAVAASVANEGDSSDEGAPDNTAADGSDTSAAESPAEEILEPPLLIELVGAGTRVPGIEKRLASAFPGVAIGHRLNTDDSVALGATMIGTRATAFIRIRGFAVDDSLPCAPTFGLSVDDEQAFPEKTRLAPTPVSTRVTRELFASCRKLPCRKSVSVRVSQPGQAAVPNTLSLTLSSPSGSCDPENEFIGVERQTLTVSGIEEVAAQAVNNSEWRLEDITVTVRVELTLSADGIVTAGAATARASKPKVEKADGSEGADQEVAPTDGETASDSVDSSESKPSTEDSDNAAKEGEAKKDKKSKKQKNKKKTAKKKKKDKRHTYGDLSFAGPPSGASTAVTVQHWYFFDEPRPMNGEARAASQSFLLAISAAEEAARLAAIKKNELETLVLMERDEVRHGNNEKAQQLFKSIGEWLETGDGASDSSTAADFEEQLSRLGEALAASPADEL